MDDEVTIADFSARILGQLGYSVTSMTSSVEALELVRKHPNSFDLVISDVTMPNMAGDELAREILQIRPDIPIILATGYSKKLLDGTIHEVGAKALISKPVTREDLAGVVRKVLDEE